MGYIRHYCCSLDWETNNMTKTHQTSARIRLIYSPLHSQWIKPLLKGVESNSQKCPIKRNARTLSESFPFPHPALIRGEVETFEETLMESERQGPRAAATFKVPFFLLKSISLCVSFIVRVFPQAQCTKKPIYPSWEFEAAKKRAKESGRSHVPGDMVFPL